MTDMDVLSSVVTERCGGTVEARDVPHGVELWHVTARRQWLLAVADTVEDALDVALALHGDQRDPEWDARDDITRSFIDIDGRLP